MKFVLNPAVFCCDVRKPAVVMIVGVNGGGKTTSLGEHKHILFPEIHEIYYCLRDLTCYVNSSLVRGALLINY